MEMFDLLQLIGGVVLAVGYIPQIVQLIKKRSCRDLNLKTYITLTVGIGLMEIYAVNLAVHGSGIMFLVTNSLSLLLTAAISALIIFIRLNNRQQQ
jgi:MtN3 and saliva related transmembrane protein